MGSPGASDTIHISSQIRSAGVNLNEPDTRQRLSEFIARASGGRSVTIVALERMSGGAVQENWALDVELDDTLQRWVLRTDAGASVRESSTRAQEFTVLNAVQPAKVFAPKPLYLCEDMSVTGRRFFIMERLPGVAAGYKVTRDPKLVPDPARLARELALTLARMHQIKPGYPGLDFLEVMLARDNIAHYRSYLDTLPRAHPVLEWGLRWCEVHAPEKEETTFIHRDYRSGNYLVHDGHLAGVLDWEFPAFGNPLEDIGWICARCWRFTRPDLPVGGIAKLEDFIPVYERASGRTVSPRDLAYWQVMAHLRWAMIALQQAERHLSGGEPSLELALTGHIVGQLELEILNLTERA
jgi:aminoglycoside phosphotransferase (APT) family kinase protein